MISPAKLFPITTDLTNVAALPTQLLAQLLTHNQDAVFLILDGVIYYASPSGLALLLATEEQQIIGRSANVFFSSSEQKNSTQLIENSLKKNPAGTALLCQCQTLDGTFLDVEIRASNFALEGRSAIQLTVRNLEQFPHTLKLAKTVSLKHRVNRVQEALHHEKEILEMIALDNPLSHILQDVCDRMERLLDNGSICTIMLLDPNNQYLSLGAAPSMPDEFANALEHLKVGVHAGTCAAAIHFNQLTIVEDIQANTYWADLRNLAAKHRLRSCWSLPIKTAFNALLGTVDVYHSEVHTPGDDEQASIMDAMDLIAIAIDKKNMERSLEQSEDRYRSVVTNLTEGIMVLAPGGQILTCNPSAKRILKITDEHTTARRHRYFSRILAEDSTTIKVGDDPASLVFKTGVPILNLSIGLELRDHTIAWLLVNVLPIKHLSNTGASAVMISFTDTTESRETQRQLNYIAAHDALTGLPNRHQLHQRLTAAISTAPEHKVAVIFLDLDRFKNVNDTAGHAAGDSLLCDVSNRLSSCIRASDMLARLGGDEFVIVAENFENAQHLKDLAERILAAIREPFHIDGNEYHLGTSIGISVFPHDALDGPTLLRCADSAMYLAKESGRNNYQFFTTELNVRAQHRYTLEKNLRRALIDEEFLVYYQPKVCLRTSRIVGAEALIRWKTPDGALILPEEFIPISEDIGLIVQIGHWVLEQACSQAQAWREKLAPDLVISVNISPKQFQDPNLAKNILQILDDTGLAPQSLQLEITEGLLMGEVELLLPVFTAIKNLGINISLDDFGTGFSSLSYLQRFPIDNLKIDRSFIRDVPGNKDSVTLTHAIIAMAKALGMSVTAEGVEKADQMHFLTESGCQEMQGFFFSEAIPAADFENLLLTHTQ